MEEAPPEQRPSLFRVTRGAPSDAEIAALTVVLAAAVVGHSDTGTAQRDAWSDPAMRLRVPLTVGPDAWRRSCRPGGSAATW